MKEGAAGAPSPSPPFALAVAQPPPGWKAQAEFLRFLLNAPGPSQVLDRAVAALGLLPEVAWAHLESASPRPCGTETPATCSIALQGTGTAEDRQRPLCLTVGLAVPQDREHREFVRSLLDLVRRVHDMVGLVRRLADDAHTDPLTGLWNRRAFLDLLDQAVARHRRGGDPAAVLLCDLDHFKTINDRFGHEAGDRALCAVAEAIREVTRPTDVAARLGGDEVCLLLAGATERGAVTVGRRLMAALERVNPLAPHRLTLSMGVADVGRVGRSRGMEARRRLLRAADAALYAAKAAGRNRVATPPRHPADPLERTPTIPIHLSEKPTPTGSAPGRAPEEPALAVDEPGRRCAS